MGREVSGSEAGRERYRETQGGWRSEGGEPRAVSPLPNCPASVCVYFKYVTYATKIIIIKKMASCIPD